MSGSGRYNDAGDAVTRLTRLLAANPEAAEASLRRLAPEEAAVLLCSVLQRERGRVRRWQVRRTAAPALAFGALWVFPSYAVRKFLGGQFDGYLTVGLGAMFAGGLIRRSVAERAHAATRPARHAALLLGEMAPSLQSLNLSEPLRDALPTLALLKGGAEQDARAAVLIAYTRLLHPISEKHTT